VGSHFVQTLDARLAAEGGASRAEPLFASFGVRTVGPERIASIGLDLSKVGHPLVNPSAFLDTELSASAR